MKLINNIKFWIKNSRPYTIPITALSFLVVFVYSLCHEGNLTAGIIAYIGIALVHLATNLSDDYFDYKALCCRDEFCAKDCKCAYLRDNSATVGDLKNAIIMMLGIAAICGIILFFISGFGVIFFALAVLPIAIFYSKLSSRGLGDLAVILAYGPLMFGGVCYAMTGGITFEIIVLSLACAIIVETILYTHMLMDFKDDIKANKITLCTKLGTPQRALQGLLVLYITAYILILMTAKISGNYNILISYLTIPAVVKLYKSLKIYNQDDNFMPSISIMNYPLNTKRQLPVNAPFFHRFFLAINISTLFMLLTALGVAL